MTFLAISGKAIFVSRKEKPSKDEGFKCCYGLFSTILSCISLGNVNGVFLLSDGEEHARRSTMGEKLSSFEN